MASEASERTITVEEGEPAALSAEVRRRNVERVRRVEGRLGALETRLATVVYEAGRCLREVHAQRDELRAIFGMAELLPVAPAFVAPTPRPEAPDG